MALSPSPASRLLLLAARRDSAGESLRNLLPELHHHRQGEAFLELAQGHGVLGLVCARLEREGLLGPAAGWAPALERSHQDLIRQETVLDLERDRLLAMLADARVGPVLLKGAALRLTTYAEPVERPLFDLDLLVSPSETDVALRTLITAGYQSPPAPVEEAYRRHHFHLPLQHPGGFVVELHWALNRPGSPFALESEGFLRRSENLSRNPTTRVPAPEDLLLHLASQGPEDSFQRLGRFVDLDRIVALHPALDWEAVLGAAGAGGLVRVLAHALGCAGRLLGTEIPPMVAQRLRPPLPTRIHLAVLAPPLLALEPRRPLRPAADRLLTFWLLQSVRARLHLLGETLQNRADPMSWVWNGRGSGGGFAVLKMFTYQLFLYLTAPFRLVR